MDVEDVTQDELPIDFDLVAWMAATIRAALNIAPGSGYAQGLAVSNVDDLAAFIVQRMEDYPESAGNEPVLDPAPVDTTGPIGVDPAVADMPADLSEDTLTSFFGVQS